MSNVIYKQYGGRKMSEVTDRMLALANEAAKAEGQEDYSLEDENALLVKMNRTLIEANFSANHQLEEAADKLNQLSEKSQKLLDAHTELVKKYDQTPELVFLSFSLDPAGTLQDFLKHMERQAKIEDQSGDAWKWKFQLTLKNRLKIALKLIFRPKIKEEVI